MKKEDKNRTRRVRSMVILCALIAVIVSVATYAWFIGMRTVYVSPFDISISSTDSLLLSLDGKNWNDTITVDDGILVDNTGASVTAYENNTNTLGGERGLVPMSSVGEMDATASRMMLFEKASLTATPGGYRLMASRVANDTNLTDPEPSGYVAFDLFIKNSSGREYYGDKDILNEEAIYLTVDSEVTVASSGVANTGIENSVRVAFAQIGRVSGDLVSGSTTNDETVNVPIITGITCDNNSTNGVTGICRDAQIWEPNDRNHTSSAIKWYNEACASRTGTPASIDPKDGAYNATSYGALGSCSTVVDGLAYPTYATTTAFDFDKYVDVYDGKAYNGYEETTNDGLLQSYPYFTDSEKLLKGTERPEFMRLAPNSITKVRVYIWIEGQDVDNYDFASIGKAISVAFGFTKERFNQDDIDYYDEPWVNQGSGPGLEDLTAPMITLEDMASTTSPNAVLDLGESFTDPGVLSVTDNVDTFTTPITVEPGVNPTTHETITYLNHVVGTVYVFGTVNTAEAGTYQLVYKVWDTAGNLGVAVRTVTVRQTP